MRLAILGLEIFKPVDGDISHVGEVVLYLRQFGFDFQQEGRRPCPYYILGCACILISRIFRMSSRVISLWNAYSTLPFRRLRL